MPLAKLAAEKPRRKNAPGLQSAVFYLFTIPLMPMMASSGASSVR